MRVDAIENDDDSCEEEGTAAKYRGRNLFCGVLFEIEGERQLLQRMNRVRYVLVQKWALTGHLGICERHKWACHPHDNRSTEQDGPIRTGKI